jgi:hypothetical protein
MVVELFLFIIEEISRDSDVKSCGNKKKKKEDLNGTFELCFEVLFRF